MLESCEDYIRPLLTVAVNTGMRRGELFALQWRDVNFAKGLITVQKPKNDETRYVPMNKAVQESLADYRSQQARGMGELVTHVFVNPRRVYPTFNIRKPFRRALRKAGIGRHIRFHDLRHTAASHMVMSGIDRDDVGKILGHKDPKMTRRYGHLAPDYLKDTIDNLNYSASKGEGREKRHEEAQ